MVTKGTKTNYVQFLGGAATGVTQSCHLVRIAKYAILFDCGIYQESDIRTNYEKNRELLKKLRPHDIDWIILHEAHADHTALVPALFAKGCQAHIIVPKGTTQFLKLLWLDSAKIMSQDCQKLQRKHGVKASPFYNEADIDTAINRCLEVEPLTAYNLCKELTLTYYPSNHIINACQISLEIKQGYKKTVLNFTGDIGSEVEQPYVIPRVALPFGDLTISENTYNSPARQNKRYDRDKDRDKIATALNQYRQVLFPVFALGRTQTIVTEIYTLWKDGRLPKNIKVIIDSPLGHKISDIYPIEDELWAEVMKWHNLKFVGDYAESIALQTSNEPMVILASAGMLTAGRGVSWCKKILPNRDACIMFSGYASQNTLASQIRFGNKSVMVDGDLVENNANLIELVSYSSHAAYEELTKYLTEDIRFNKLALVHGNYQNKVEYTHYLQDKLSEQGKSARVVCVTQDQKLTF